MALAFQKYEGLGNDFVIVEADRADAIPASVAASLCDRRRGVGGDGVLLLLPPSSPGAVGRMRVLNADGSVPEMCGNGLRCAVLHVARRRGQIEGEVVFDTDAGVRPCLVDDREGRGLVTVDMGAITVADDLRIDVGGEPWEFVTASAGNPHAISILPAGNDRGHERPSRALIDRVGPVVSTHASFPAGTNVELAAFGRGRIELLVWERGVGVTQACGTGACATVGVGVAKGLCAAGEEVVVALPGGELFITMRSDGHAIMRGPARHVFSGQVDLDSVASGRDAQGRVDSTLPRGGR